MDYSTLQLLPAKHADFERRVAEIACQMSDLELPPEHYGGALMYMVAYYDLLHKSHSAPPHRPTPAPPSAELRRLREENDRLREENAELRDLADRAQGTGDYARRGDHGKPRTRFATEAERRAYTKGWRTGYHSSYTARRRQAE